MNVINRTQQRGMTAIGWLFVIALLAFTTVMVLKLVPIYLEQFSIRSSFSSLVELREGAESPQALKETLLRRLSINNVKSIADDDIVVVRQGGSYEISTNYEVRVPFLWNIDFVVGFDNHAEVAAR